MRSQTYQNWNRTAAALIVMGGLPWLAGGQTFYVSEAGSDTADGLTPATAWRSLDKVNSTSYTPGSSVLFERGSEWRGNLLASSSGTTEAPITYGAYGSGEKPRFWGSDAIANSSFTPVAGTTSTYQVTSQQVVNSVLSDHSFLRPAFRLTGSSNPILNRAYVNANPNTWTYVGDTLYVNTGGSNPTADGRFYTAAVRENVVDSNGKDNLIFRDLVADESAKYNGGYAFRIQQSDNVRVEDCEAYRAGKHHFGVINSRDFVGTGLRAEISMPDQGLGGATAYVTYADANQVTGADSAWVDCVAENLGGYYPGFYNHGTGVGNVLLKNMTVRGGGPGIELGTDSADQNIQVIGGHLDNAGLTLYGDGILVDGVRITGEDSFISLRGNNNVIQNVLMTGTLPDTDYYSAVHDSGVGNVLQYNTIVLDPNSPGHSTAVAFLNPATNTQLLGNIFDTPDAVLAQMYGGRGLYRADFNMYSPDARVVVNYLSFTMAQWRLLGFDVNMLLADPAFVDALAGDYRLADGSLAIDRIGFDVFENMPGWDFFEQARPAGTGYDLGAIEAVPEPSSFALVGLTGSLLFFRRRARR